MSIVADQVRRVDSQLDRLQLANIKSATSSPVLTYRRLSTTSEPTEHISSSPQIDELQVLIKALSATSSSKALLPAWRISMLLEQAGLEEGEVNALGETKSPYEKELEWLLVSKATVQAYGVLLNTLLEQTIPLSNDIWYWDEVLGSYTFTAIYTIQTSPLRLWDWTKDIYEDSRNRFARLREAPEETLSATSIGTNVTARWKTFYGLVRDSIRERSVTDIQARVLSPLAKSRSEARRKQAGLKRLREMSASGLGVLMDEGLNFDIAEDNTGSHGMDGSDWNVVVERSVALMDTVLRNVTALETGVSEFEDIVFASVADDPEISSRSMGMGELRDKPAKLCKRLQNILSKHIPAHVQAQQHLRSQYGRPSRLVRYWLPATALLLSSTTILRIVVNRKAAILQWIQDLGSTMQDFWMNWIVDPTKKIIKTIRHDEGSEVAIMSRESLKGDRDSLERMVVDFAIDNPQASGMGGSLSEEHIAEIRAKVKEGDLTPVLRAYEKDLRRPFVGTVRGDLVRTLLIQVQKTKVDVEVALSGIDALLKSQELVFGFVGLTPGILVCIGVGRYISGMFGERRGQKYGHRAGQMIRVLRHIDRILTTSTPSPSGILSYKDHGLLLCEVHVLRSRAAKLFPGEVEREFFEDVSELGDISIGIERQLKVVQRIRWAYGKWLSKISSADEHWLGERVSLEQGGRGPRSLKFCPAAHYPGGSGSSGTALVEAHKPAELVKLLDLQLPETGGGKTALLDVIQQVLKYSVNTWDQGFLDKLYASTNPVGVVSELILATLNTNSHVYQVSPALTVIEKAITKKFANLYGFTGPHAGGFSTQGGSGSNLSALIIARNTLYPETKTDGNGTYNFVIFTSAHGHYSFEKAAQMIGLGSRNLVPVPVDAVGAMIPSELERLILAAKDAGKTPLLVNATAGSTVLGSFDPFEEIAAVARKHGMWMHVDGAWGGSVVFSETQRHKLKGVHLADSVAVNPHKMLGAPTTCSLLLGKDLRQFHRANTLPAGYLFHGADADGEVWDLADLTPQCGRRPDSLKVMLSWTYYGAEGYGRMIDEAFNAAAYLARLVEKNKDFVLVSQNPPPCLQVCFYYAPGGLEEVPEKNTVQTAGIVEKLVERGFMVDHAPGERGNFFRVVVNVQTRKGTLDGLVKAIVDIGKE
ncbi:hypothetical protein O988_00427 [Pseudogymnoascus sp. VKM F-3808]|nr:hypothetical protein O988_00427 [Pseudogymnoascus sp. VKM F-3808]